MTGKRVGNEAKAQDKKGREMAWKQRRTMNVQTTPHDRITYGNNSSGSKTIRWQGMTTMREYGATVVRRG